MKNFKSFFLATVVSFLVLLLIVISINVEGETVDENNNSSIVQEELDFNIYLKRIVFDPLIKEPEIIIPPSSSKYRLVQVKGNVQSYWVKEMEATGAELMGYIPEHSYIVRLINEITEIEDNLNSLSFVRWVGPYQPLYKIDPALDDVTGVVEMDITPFRGICWAENLINVRESIESLGGEITYEGTEHTPMRVKIHSNLIPQIARIDDVEWIGAYTPPRTLMDNIRIFTGAERLHETELNDTNINGTNIVGEIKDSGIYQDHPEFEGQIIGIDGDADETNHGTSTFGIAFAIGIEERARGMDFGGKGVFCQWDVPRYDSIQHLVENWDGIFQSNSWYQGSTDSTYNQYSEEDDQAVFDFDISMLYAAGNGGSDESCSNDAVAKNVITVGGVDHYDNTDRTDDEHTGNQGNKGPASDGRIKPDLCGPYDAIYTTTGENGYTENFGGTSGATPVNAGALGLLYQMYKANYFGKNPLGRIPHAATAKAILIADAYQYEFTQADRFAQGWGLIDIGNVYDVGQNHFIVDEDILLESSESAIFEIQPTTFHPLKISLVWTDVPGTTSSSKHLINDLDLKVTDPEGTVYHGNYGLEDDKWSLSEGSRDDLNNVENVFIESPISGVWRIEVIAYDIPEDGDTSTPELDQNFALVASGVIDEEHDMSIAQVDLPTYFEPNRISNLDVMIFNFGKQDENNIKINLIIDGYMEDSFLISSLSSGGSQIAKLEWTPKEERFHNLSVFIEPVEDESIIYNNWFNHSIDVFKPLGRILIDEGHGNSDLFNMFYESLIVSRYQVYYTSDTIDLEEISKYSVFVTAQATQTYQVDEIQALLNFVSNGGGLLVMGDDNPAIYNDLTSDAGINWQQFWAIPGTTDNLNDEHEITSELSALYFDFPEANLNVDEDLDTWVLVEDEIPLIPNILSAAALYDNGRIVAVSDDECLNNDNIGNEENWAFGFNIIDWINTNIPPIAIIDSPNEGSLFSPLEIIYFDGSSSFDPENNEITFLWTSNIDGDIGNSVSFDKKITAGKHLITLKVEDEYGASSQTQVNITVNTPPMAVISSPENDKLYLTSINIEFNASVSIDNDGNVLSYIWESSIDGIIGIEKIFYKNLSAGEHIITLRVNDSFEEDEEKITITINTPPKAIIDKPENNSLFQTTEIIEFDASSSYDPEDEISFTWESDISGVISHEKKFSKNLVAGKHKITLTVEDNRNGVDETQISLNINTKPKAVIDFPIVGEIFQITESITFDASSSYDDDFDSLKFKWISDIDGEIGTSKIFSKKLSSGTHVITLEVNDYRKGTRQTKITIIVNSQPYAIIDSPKSDIIYLTTKEIDFDCTSCYDLEGDELNYKWTSSIDNELGNTREFNKKLSRDTHTITLEITDARGGRDEKQITILVNAPPIAKIDSPEDEKTYLTTQDILFDASSSNDLDNDVLEYKWTSDIDNEIGNNVMFSRNLSAGNHKIVLEVNDGKGGINNLEIFIFVNSPPKAVIVEPKTNSIFLTNEAIEFDASSSYDLEDELSFSWFSSIDGEIGNEVKFSTKLSSGTHTITLTVDDNRGGINIKEFTLEINTPPVAIIVSPSDGEVLIESKKIIFDADSSFDKDNDNLIYTWTSNIDGMLYSGISNGFRKKLSGGEHTIELKVEDERNGVDQVSISIFVNTAPIAIIDYPLTQSNFSTEESIFFKGTSSYDPDGDTLKFSWISNIDGNLGDNTEISTFLSEGEHTITLRVEDNYGTIDEENVTVKIEAEEGLEKNNIADESNEDNNEIYWIGIPVVVLALGLFIGFVVWRRKRYEEWNEFEEEYE